MENLESWLSFIEGFVLVLGMHSKWIRFRELSGMYFYQII